jgi:hypothetical protein
MGIGLGILVGGDEEQISFCTIRPKPATTLFNSSPLPPSLPSSLNPLQSKPHPPPTVLPLRDDLVKWTGCRIFKWAKYRPFLVIMTTII